VAPNPRTMRVQREQRARFLERWHVRRQRSADGAVLRQQGPGAPCSRFTQVGPVHVDGHRDAGAALALQVGLQALQAASGRRRTARGRLRRIDGAAPQAKRASVSAAWTYAPAPKALGCNIRLRLWEVGPADNLCKGL
jgi:hypothetical protein